MNGRNRDSFWRWSRVSLEVPMASTSRRKAATAVLIWKIPAATACDGLLDDDDGDDREPFCRSWKLIFFFLCFLFCFFGFQKLKRKRKKKKKKAKWKDQSPLMSSPNRTTTTTKKQAVWEKGENRN